MLRVLGTARSASAGRGEADRRGRAWALAAACVLACAPAAGAQGAGWQALPGAEAERYLRALQVAGEAPLYPWSVRGFSPVEIDRLLSADSTGPWRRRARAGGPGVRVLPARGEVTYNSAFPYGRNDGPVWAGRGVTASGSLGASARWGALSIRLEPTAFWTENRSFALLENGRAGDLAFADPDHPVTIDAPQRFGDGAYSRIDPGQSEARVDAGAVTLGVSTMTQQWGPAVDHPLLLGPEGPGFPHAFLGTARPVAIGIGRLHARLMWGRLGQSAYSVVPEDSAARVASGLTAVFLPWGLDGLEVGVSRFFHVPTPGGAELRDFFLPLETFFKSSLPDDGETADRAAENQLASVHARYVFPRAGAEVYGEYLRDDHSYDLQDFFLEPDHSASWMLGAARAWRRGRSLLWARAEIVSAQPSHIKEVRVQNGMYLHSVARQGHTHLGQLLGTPAALGGGGSILALEAFTPRGRWSVDWTRTRIRDNWGDLAAREPDPDPQTDVVHSLGGEATFFQGPVDVVARMRTSFELNRHFSGDAFNLTASFGVRIGL